MSFYPSQINGDLLSPQSDEKMDTGSESYRSQDTPNSLLSSDSEEQENVLRLQNPESEKVLRLSEPEANDNKTAASRFKEELSDSFITKMSTLAIHTNADQTSKNLGISPPKLASTLTSTTNHPLMSLSSPDENYPDLIPKKIHKEDEKDWSLSSVEDERPNDTNGYYYSPQRNTSKNNLYFTENFVTADSQILNDTRSEAIPPDVARVSKFERRKIIPKISETPPKQEIVKTPQRVLGRMVDSHRDESAIDKYIEERNKKLTGHSTPKISVVDDSIKEEYHTGVAEWCESSSHIRSANFELPIELSSNVNIQNDLESPDVLSSSTQEDLSLYKVSVQGNCVALKQNCRVTLRRKIQVPEDDDSCSVDSISGCSLGSEEEPPPPPELEARPQDEEEFSKRSKSTSTVSECSEQIPEYSAAEELRDERSWLTVKRGGAIATCDMKVISPYKRVISHGGYGHAGAAVIVVSACYLPDNRRVDYAYVMDNLFLYVIWTLERLVTDDYILIYLHGSAGRGRLPSFHWLRECYKLIDRRLRKSLKHLYLVHPTFWLKSFVILTKPFVSSKFFRKLSYVKNLDELFKLVPVEPNAIPELVKQYDAEKR